MAQTLRPIFSMTSLFVSVNIFVTLYLWHQGLSLTSPTSIDLILWGGNLGPLTLTNDPWRLLTSMFIHGGLLHLGLNMLLLIQVGTFLEAQIGKLRFVTTYILTGLLANLVSALWYSHQAVNSSLNYTSFLIGPTFVPIVSIGASGAIMGIAATTLVIAWWSSRQQTSEGAQINVNWNSLAQVIVLNVGMGFFISGVDNLCHIGGVVSGLIVGGLFVPTNPLGSPKQNTGRFIFVLLAGLTLLGFFTSRNQPDELVQISNNLNTELKQAQREKILIKHQAQAEAYALQEKKLIPTSVAETDATGSSFHIDDGGPIDFTVNPEESKAYILNRDSNNVQVVDLLTMRLLQTIQGPKFSEAKNSDCSDHPCLGRGATHLALSKDEKWALISSFEADKVVKIDLETGKVGWSVDAGKFPNRIVISPNEKWAYALSGHANTLAIIDIDKELLKENPPLSENEIVVFQQSKPISMALSQKTSNLFIVDTPGRQILTLNADNPGSLTQVKKFDSISPMSIMFSDDKEEVFWVTGLNERGLNVYQSFKTKDFSEVDQFVTCAIPLGPEIALSPKSKWMAVKSPNENNIRIASLLGLNTVRVLPATSYNTLLKFSKDGSTLFALSQQHAQGVLTKYDVSKTLDVDTFLSNSYEAICLSED